MVRWTLLVVAACGHARNETRPAAPAGDPGRRAGVVYQGVRDPVTPQHEADQIVAALRRRHVPVEYMLIANEGHGVTRRENILSYLARSYRFLSEHMALP